MLVVLVSIWIFVARLSLLTEAITAIEFPASCADREHDGGSDDLANISTSSLALKTALPLSLGLVHTCRIILPESAALLQITARKTTTKEGSLHVNVYEPDRWRTLGRLSVLSTTGHSSQKSLCLPKHGPSSLPHYVTFSGTPGLEFSAQLQAQNSTIKLDEQKNFTLGDENRDEFIFQFTSSTNDFRTFQLDITVRSKDTPTAYLVVSHYCERVSKEERGIIDKTKPSMFLTFQKQGRITLSKVSRPKLTEKNTTLFIGVYKSRGKGSKTVNIVLRKSFNYDYTDAMCFIFFVSLLGGFLVAYWALVCFREPLTLIEGASSLESTSASGSIPRESKWKKVISCRNIDNSNELEPLIKTPRPKAPATSHELISAMWVIIKYHWFGIGPKTFSYITCIVGSVLMVGAFQFVYENWFLMKSEGDRDLCFYNDFCYRVSPNSDIPFNLMISNLAYMIHGMILALSVWVMEAELYVQAKKKAKQNSLRSTSGVSTEKEALPRHALICTSPESHLPQLSVPKYEPSTSKLALQLYSRAYKKKYSFSIGYAFAWALLFEGFFSLTYHLCPSKLTFQFDSAFMLVIAGLIILSLYNGFSVKDCPTEKGIQKPVEATAFFLFVIVPLFILNYVGSVHNEDQRLRASQNTTGADGDTYTDDQRLPQWATICYILFMITWYMLMYLWAGYKLFYLTFTAERFSTCANITKVILFSLTVICTCVVFPTVFSTDISNVFLFSAITASMLSVLGKIIIKATQNVSAHWTYQRMALRALQVLYTVVFLGTMVAAVYVFLGVPTSDKTLSPAKSRNLNRECALLGFFAAHDIWHILSSFSLLMGAFLVMFISE